MASRTSRSVGRLPRRRPSSRSASSNCGLTTGRTCRDRRQRRQGADLRGADPAGELRGPVFPSGRAAPRAAGIRPTHIDGSHARRAVVATSRAVSVSLPSAPSRRRPDRRRPRRALRLSLVQPGHARQLAAGFVGGDVLAQRPADLLARHECVAFAQRVLVTRCRVTGARCSSRLGDCRPSCFRETESRNS